MRKTPLNFSDARLRVAGVSDVPRPLLERAGGFNPDFFHARYALVLSLDSPIDRAEMLRHYLATVGANRFSPHEGFNEAGYISQNPDVVRLIDLRLYHSGYHHWLIKGRDERRRGWELPHDLPGQEIEAAGPVRSWTNGRVRIGTVVSPEPLPTSRSELRQSMPWESIDEAWALGTHQRFGELLRDRTVEIPPGSEDGTQETDPEAIRPFFDNAFYQLHYGDLDPRVDPLHHYLHVGWREGRDPSAWFSTAFYLAQMPALSHAGTNPLVHYVRTGRAEGRLSRPRNGTELEMLRCLTPLSARPDEPPAFVPALDDEQLMKAISAALRGRNRLVVSLSHSCYPVVIGGTETLVGAEQRRMNADGFAYLHLSPASRALRLRQSDEVLVQLRIVLDGTIIGLASSTDSAKAIRASTKSAARRVFVVHSVLGHKVEDIVSLYAATNPGSAYFWLHDYSSLCAGFNLLRNDVTFCRAPPPESGACSICVYGGTRQSHLRDLDALFHTIPFDVVAPSRATRDIWQAAHAFAHRRLVVMGHASIDYDSLERDLRPTRQIGTPPHPVRVAFTGYPSPHKGWATFERILDATAGDQGYAFYHFAALDKLVVSDRIIAVQTGPGIDGTSKMPMHLSEHAVDLVVLPATTPETFSFVAHEGLAAGCDLITLVGSGNIADLTRITRRGLVFDDAEALTEFFAGGNAKLYVRARAEHPIPVGRLRATGTTASLEKIS